MDTVWKLVKSFRPKTILLGTILPLIGFIMVNMKGFTFWILLVVLMGQGATMLTNDYVDRHHDIKKNKSFAHDHPMLVQCTATVLWIITTMIGIRLFLFNPAYGFLSALQIVLGINYSLSYKIPFGPNNYVALTVASVMFYPYLASFSWNILLVGVGVYLYIFAREILKDMDDAAFDSGYKWSIPVEYGTRLAYIASAMLYFDAGVVLTMINPYAVPILLITAAVGIDMVLTQKHRVHKTLFDFVFIAFLAGYAIWAS